MDWTDVPAVLFDLDGVLTPTVEIHKAAWSRMFNDFFVARGIDQPYTEADYHEMVDGRPRMAAVVAVLASRDVAIPEGSPADTGSAETLNGLATRKNDDFLRILAEDGIEAYPGSLALLDRLESLGIKMAVVTSSRNSKAVLDAAGLSPRFPIVVDGNTALAEKLAGKPAPDMYLRGAELLGVSPRNAVVFEDALSGVAAGKAGRFGQVIGVDRGSGRQALLAAGATSVVDDLGELA